MGNGMTDYWRARRAAEQEQKVMRDLYIFIRCLLDKKPTPRVMERETNKILAGMFDNMVIK